MEKPEVETQKFIVKFFPEIMIKGSTAKRQMINQLYNNLKKILTRINEEISIKKFFDKIEVVCPIDVVTEVRLSLLQTPGVQILLEALQFTKITTLDQIKVIVNENTRNQIIGKSFVVRVKRSGTHDFKSVDVEKTVGGYMLANNDTKGVSLKNAEAVINIELFDNQLNIITLKHKGLGGFPIGTQGEVLSLMSGGFDSTVASYLTMKRGIKTHFIFFNYNFYLI